MIKTYVTILDYVYLIIRIERFILIPEIENWYIKVFLYLYLSMYIKRSENLRILIILNENIIQGTLFKYFFIKFIVIRFQ